MNGESASSLRRARAEVSGGGGRSDAGPGRVRTFSSATSCGEEVGAKATFLNGLIGRVSQVMGGWRVFFLGVGFLGAFYVSGSSVAPGSPDPGFRPRIETVSADGVPMPGMVQCLAVQPDGRILVGGRFSRVNGFSRTNLARLHPDGSLDTQFQGGLGAAGEVEALVLRPDGFIWVGGSFKQVHGQRRVGLARLDTQGALDARFELTPEMDGEVHALALQSDGKLLFGGKFEVFDLPVRPLKSLARLNVNSTLDDAFSSDLSSVPPEFPRLDVLNILPQGGERILLVAQSPLASAGFASLWSIRPNGEREREVFWFYDTSRRELKAFRYPDGRLLVSDSGDRAGGSPTLFRFTPTGEMDASFQPWYLARVTAAAILPDGRAVLGGFSDLAGATGGVDINVARLRLDGSLDPTFGRNTRVDGYVAAMALQADGQVLLAGKISGVSGISLAGLCRLTGGDAEGPTIVTPPTNQTLVAGRSVSLQVVAAGTEPLFYQWRNRDRNLRDQTNSLLSLTNVLNTESHIYSVQVSNWAGVITSSVARLSVSAPTRIVQQPENLTYRPGNSLRFIVYADGPAPLSYSWFFNGTQIPGATTSELLIDKARPEDAGEYWVEVSGPGGKVVSSKAFFQLRVVQAGDVDPSFAPGAGALGRVSAVVALTNGNVIIGGNFTNVAGLPRKNVALLQTNGIPVPDFHPQLPDDFTFSALAAFESGDILVGGYVGRDFSARGYLARLNPTGSRLGEMILPQGAGASIASVAIQSDEKVVMGGIFQWHAGPTHTYVNLARLTPYLGPDLSFPTNLALNGVVSRIHVDAQDRIVVGGSFTEVQHQPRTAIARLVSDGRLDFSFDAGAIRNLGGSGSVYRIAETPAGGYYIAGSFDQVGGWTTRNIARLTASGGIDSTFGFSLGTTQHEEIQSLCVQTNGWLVVGGRFDPYHGGGISANALRLRLDGSLDETFGPSLGLSPDIACLALQRDQKLLVGGDLVVQNPGNQRGIVRLLVGDPTAPFFVRQPEDSRLTPGADVLLWGEAEGSRRLGYSWEKDGQPLPGATNTALILRQLVPSQGGAYTLVASNAYGITRSRPASLRILEPPVILTAPTHQTNVVGQSVVLHVGVSGSEPFRYEWSRDGVWLRWVTGPTLTLDPVSLQDAATYSVNVINDLTSVRSSTFRMTVVAPPEIVSQPADRVLWAESSASLAVNATGTLPMGFRWWNKGQPLVGQTNATLSWVSVSADDQGSYRVVVTNAWGAITSAPVRIDVLVSPAFVRQPENQSGEVGGTATFETQAIGQPLPYYQWLFGNLEIPGANGPALILTNLQPAQAGLYSVIAGSVAGTVRSAQVRLSVIEVPSALREVKLSVLADGSFALEAQALEGRYQIEGSEDLVNWIVLWNQPVTDGRLLFTDHDAVGRSRRYYRVVYTPSP